MQKIKVVIIIYNRLNNLKRWIDCWKQSNQEGAELIVIHNIDREVSVREFKNVCDAENIKYIQRENIGYDIGVFQDVCKERLSGFDNNWDKLLWITDDVIPMTKDFLKTFLQKSQENENAVICTEISNQIRPHIRTTGFLISKSASKKLFFPVERIYTKLECYSFEHGEENNFLLQIQKLGMEAIIVEPILANSPLWDTEIRSYLGRTEEFNSVFKKDLSEKVTFICPVYNTYPEIVSSLINQTHKNWKLLLIHDGKNETGLKKIISTIGDERITYIEFAERKGYWGHFYRQCGLKNMDIISPNTDYVVITNADNHHVPTYIETLLTGFKENPNAVATYCSKMVHSYLAPQQTTVLNYGQVSADNLKWDNYKYGVIDCKLQLGYIDCAGVMIKKSAACSVGWRDIKSHSSDWTYFDDIIKKYGASKWIKVSGCLLIHN